MVLFAKNGPLWGLKSPKITLAAKKCDFSNLKISIPYSNQGKRNLKLMLIRPQKGLVTTHFDSEIVTIIWYFDPISVRITKNTPPLQNDFGVFEGGGILRLFDDPTLKGGGILRKVFFWGAPPPRPPVFQIIYT